MKEINFITNIPIKSTSGGWSGMNYNIFKQLEKEFSINLVDNISPPISPISRYVSKALRLLKSRGSFTAFSESRLTRISQLVNQKLNLNSKYNFYHGATPWILIKNNVPYGVYLDCCFKSYISIYQDKNSFSKKQLNKIFALEKQFIESAHAVFFSSTWALNETLNQYSISSKNFFVAGLGSGLDMNPKLEANKDPYFLLGVIPI